MEEPTRPLRPEDPATGTIDMARQPVEAKIGPGGRLIGVLLSPTETFADIKQKPTWLFPLVLSTLLSLGFIFFFNWRVKPDLVAFTRKTIEARAAKTGTEISPEDAQAQAEKSAPIFKVFGYVAGLVFPTLSALVFSGCLVLAMLLVQGETTFKRIFSVYLWANCAVMSVVFQIVACATLMAKDRASLDQIDLNNPVGVAATNLGVLISSDSSRGLKALAGSADIFSVWLIIVLAIGLATTSNSKKMTKGKAAAIVTSIWLVFVLIKAGLASLGG